MDFTFNGTFTASAGEASGGKILTIGCEAGYVKLVNVTTNVVYEYVNAVGMSTAGATGVITQSDTTLTIGARTVTVDAGALSENDVVHYTIIRD